MTSLVVLKRVARWNGTRRYWRASWTELSPSIRALWILVVAMATLGTVLMGSQIGTSDQLTTVSVFSYAVAPIGAGMLLMWVAYRRRGPGVGAWILIGTGVVFWGIGELVWTYYAHVLGREVPYPGLADVMYVAAYPIIFVGVLLLPHVRPRKWERARLTLDALAGTIAVTAITWTFYLKKVVYLDPEAGFLENTVNLAYPVGDLILLIALIILTTRRSQLQFDGRLLVIGGGIILTAAADIWYLFQAEAETYMEGGRLDAVWLASYGLFAVAALLLAGKPRLRQQADRPNRLWPMLAPYTAIAVLFALTFAEIGGSATTLQIAASTVGLLIIARQGVAIRENREVVEKQRNDLVASISHELRTPLTAMTGFTEILDQAPNLDRSDRIEMISIINSQTKHLARIVGDLVEVARNNLETTKLTLEEIDVSTLVDSAIEMLAYDAAPARITTAIEPDLTVTGDIDRLRQVLLNYLTNAGRYGNGIVEVHARSLNRQVLIEVHDNGPGIPKKYELTIWERFERGAHTYMSGIQGSGLGLAIARQLVAAHHGHTGHHPSQRLGGACFWLTLPATNILQNGHRERLAPEPVSQAKNN